MNIRTNIPIVTASILKKLQTIADREYLLRPVAFDVIALMTERIHEQGKASDDLQIGTYSNGYMALRTGKFKNATKKTAGKFTDKTIRLDKKTGVFSGEEKVGKPRPNFHRSDDTKVVVSLTRQLENDWSVIATEKGYGVGFLNPFNFQKAEWVEKTYNKKIFNLTKGEKEHVATRLNQLIADALNS
jgi:hypothetical protein